jgi:hypothetical protein
VIAARTRRDSKQGSTMQQALSLSSRLAMLVVAAAAAVSLPGCGFMAQMHYWMTGDLVAAKTTCLDNKKVAVVCLDANTLLGPGSEADAVAKAVSNTLAFHVEGINIVRQQEINDWIDGQNQDLADFRDVGRGVKADMVVGIDLESFSIHEGQTLLKGRSRVRTRVFDMTQGGKLVYETPPREVAFPENGARPITENEANFRLLFIHTLARKIAKDFYSYDRAEDYGGDAAFLAD